jgi:hypothetical protein
MFARASICCCGTPSILAVRPLTRRPGAMRRACRRSGPGARRQDCGSKPSNHDIRHLRSGCGCPSGSRQGRAVHGDCPALAGAGTNGARPRLRRRRKSLKRESVARPAQAGLGCREEWSEQHGLACAYPCPGGRPCGGEGTTRQRPGRRLTARRAGAMHNTDLQATLVSSGVPRRSCRCPRWGHPYRRGVTAGSRPAAGATLLAACPPICWTPTTPSHVQRPVRCKLARGRRHTHAPPPLSPCGIDPASRRLHRRGSAKACSRALPGCMFLEHCGTCSRRQSGHASHLPGQAQVSAHVFAPAWPGACGIELHGGPPVREGHRQRGCKGWAGLAAVRQGAPGSEAA